MKRIPAIKTVAASAILTLAVGQNALAASTLVTDAVGTQELWTFEEVLGAQKLTSKTNQVDGKGITQTWDTNGNKLSHTDAEGRTTSYSYNATNQKTSMTEASGTPRARTTFYEYVSADIDLVTQTRRPSVHTGSTKEVINTYDAELNITAVTINGFDVAGKAVTRSTTFIHDAYGKVTQINGPRTDVNDLTTLQYYDCSTGAECGQLKKISNALGHSTTFDAYDAAARLLQSTDANGVVTTHIYHPRGWLLSTTQTPPAGNARVTTYDYDLVGQLTKVTAPDGSEQHYVYDAAHDLREVSDNLGNKITYSYDAKGNRTQELMYDPDGTLVRSTMTAYDHRNFIRSINTGGSITQLINDAVGNLSTQTDPNLNPATAHHFDALDRLKSTLDALSNDTAYQYNVADQLTQVQAPNGATTRYQYDDLGNQTQEISPDRGKRVYTHDDAGNVTSITDDREITVRYQYDALNRITHVTYPTISEQITYRYDATNCGASVGRLCQIMDETGQTNYAFDAWGNVLAQTKVELGVTYTTAYQYDPANRVSQMTYPNGRIVNYQRDAIGRVESVTTTVNGSTNNILTNRTYRADNTVTGQTLGNGLNETRSYDVQGRVTQISLGALESWEYAYDANGNITQIAKPAEGRDYSYDVLDRVVGEAKGLESDRIEAFSYAYDANGNRTRRNQRAYAYTANTNQLSQDGNQNIARDAVGNTLNARQSRSFTYSDSNRLRSVSKGRALKARYFYNALGQRTRKERPHRNTHVYHYDLSGNLILRTIQNGKAKEDYIWVDGELKQYAKLKGKADGTIKTEKAKTFITTDHLATPRIGTDNSQTITWRWDSDAFNKRRPNRDPDGDGRKVNVKIGFPGQYWDAESGLYYNWNRYYDAGIGRYVTSDPIGLDGGLNTYGYVGGNPLVWTDTTGRSRYKICEDYGWILKSLCKACVKTACGMAGNYCCKIDFDNCVADSNGDLDELKKCSDRFAVCPISGIKPKKPKSPDYEKTPQY